MVNVITEVNVDIDLDDIDENELIEHLEQRGYRVLFGNQKDIELELNEEIGSITDRIHDIYRDYVSGINVENKLKTFFEERLGLLVA